jgi:hypothetical protein
MFGHILNIFKCTQNQLYKKAGRKKFPAGFGFTKNKYIKNIYSLISPEEIPLVHQGFYR